MGVMGSHPRAIYWRNWRPVKMTCYAGAGRSCRPTRRCCSATEPIASAALRTIPPRDRGQFRYQTAHRRHHVIVAGLHAGGTLFVW